MDVFIRSEAEPSCNVSQLAQLTHQVDGRIGHDDTYSNPHAPTKAERFPFLRLLATVPGGGEFPQNSEAVYYYIKISVHSAFF